MDMVHQRSRHRQQEALRTPCLSACLPGCLPLSTCWLYVLQALAHISAASDASARHNCWAFKVAGSARSNDDGEPGGTGAELWCCMHAGPLNKRRQSVLREGRGREECRDSCKQLLAVHCTAWRTLLLMCSGQANFGGN